MTVLRLLAIDTTQTCAAALVTLAAGGGESQKIVVSAPPPSDAPGAVEALMPMLADVMERGGAAFHGARRPDRIAVATGPGRFTGVRVGLAAARALALTTGMELVGVSALEVVAAGADSRPGENIFSVLCAPRGAFYCQGFDGEGRSLTEPVCVPGPDCAAHLPPGPVVVAGSGSGALQTIPAFAAARFSAPPTGGMGETLGVLARLAARQEPDGPVEPLYLSRPGTGQPVASHAAMA